MARKQVNRKALIVVVLIGALILYIAGVLSGLYANKITEERTADHLQLIRYETEHDIANLREGTAAQLEHMQAYITFLETNLNTIQLEQAFLATLDEDEVCRVVNSSLHQLTEQLQVFRERLPFRLELYEKQNTLSEEYKLLKQQYTTLSLRTWLLLRNHYDLCNIVHGLYLYSRECTHCVVQGEELDTVTATLREQGKEVMLFTVDANARDPALELITTYYEITELPTIILGERVHRGFHSARELLEEHT
ncbi:MAG: hypothetical protein OXR66_01435 [Candidatus Woesearchaeota archaeon]|nr:hypothetical protein [Candidatus Woesearchaeota archaeon]